MNTHLRISSIFWKFFIGFWATILVVTGLAWTISADWQDAPQNYGSIEHGPGARKAVSTAVGLVRWGGQEALINWLKDPELNRRPEVFVVDRHGNEISGRTVPQAAVEELVQATLEANDAEPRRHGRGMRHSMMHMSIPGVTAMRISGIGSVRIFAVRTDVPNRPFMLTLWRTPWWVYLGLMLFVTSAVAWLLASRYSKPVRKLNWAMQQAASGDFTTRIAQDVGNSHNEIGALARQYDDMAERITGLLARQKRLFHDVSHELRSPLARIDVAIALAQKNPDRAHEVMVRIEREVETLDHMVDELLTYARLDNNAPMQFEVTDIVPLLDAVIEDADFEGSAKNVRVTFSSPESVLLSVHTESFLRAVENLIRNALRFSAAGATVSVALSPTPEGWLITVSDEGPGMKPDEIDRIFDPFVRGKNQATGNGFGLGLAIAKRAVERHGGTLSAENLEPHGLKMQILLPSTALTNQALSKATTSP